MSRWIGSSLIVPGALALLGAWSAGCVPIDDVDVSRDEVVLEQGLVGGEQAAPGEWDSAIYWGTNNGACSGSVVGPRHLLTAAHCVQVIDFNVELMFGEVGPGFNRGASLSITNDKTLNAQTSYAVNTIERVDMHPVWQQVCAQGCPYNNATVSPFAPDLAVITLQNDIPTEFKRARVLTGALLPGVPVSIMGYGCENGVGQQSGPLSRLKYFPTRTVDASYTQHLSSFISPRFSTLFERHYVITPGQDVHQEASLCPGDSGGPLYLTDISQGEIVVGVNAYYTFRSAGLGIATTNAHTRLGRDNPSGTTEWLHDRLPLESFMKQAPRSDLGMLGVPDEFTTTLGGTNDADVIEGQGLAELLAGREGDDLLFGGGGDDALEGHEQSDWLDGGAGNDVLRGGSGADVLDGGAGEDVLMGGEGPDVYVMTPGGGHDLVIGDQQGQNQVVCQGFDAPPRVYRQGEDWIVWSEDGTQSMRIMDSHVVSFYGCARPPVNFPF